MLCMTVMFLGCEKREARLPTFKVSGKVVQKGKAVPNATVIFHANRTEEGFIKPRAITKPDGTFELTTYESGDGAPAGTYEVSIEQWLRAKPEESPENRLSMEAHAFCRTTSVSEFLPALCQGTVGKSVRMWSSEA